AARSASTRISTALPNTDFTSGTDRLMASSEMGSTPPCAVRGSRLPEKSIEFWISVLRPAEGPGEPGTGKGPVAVGGPVGDAEEIGRGFEGHPGEVVELDQFRGGGVSDSQPVQGFVHRQNVLNRGGRRSEVVRQFDSSRLAAAFQPGLPPGAFD